jgi:hypothetical protein
MLIDSKDPFQKDYFDFLGFKKLSILYIYKHTLQFHICLLLRRITCQIFCYQKLY